MKRLDEIPKKSLFEAPDGYFEKLPGRIQARIANPEPAPTATGMAWGRLTLRYAMPLVILGAVAIFLINREPATAGPEELIASLESEQLVAYLEETDLNIDDLLEATPLDIDEVDLLEADALDNFGFDDGSIEELVEEFDSLATD